MSVLLALFLAQNVTYNISYGDEHERQKLDLYIPEKAKNAAVLIFVHGGSWRNGDKSGYDHIGNTFAKKGYLTIPINYRLSPEPWPAHIEDVALAFAWVKKNIAELGGDVEVIVDGTDNFATRMLVNDFAVSERKPWVYGGCIGAEGQSMTILPGETACLACLMSDVPPPGTTPTCDTAGVLGPIVGVVASIEAIEALKILSGHAEAVSRRLAIIDLWGNEIRRVELARLRENGDCRVCGQREFLWLSGEKGAAPAVLCGRNSVQISAAEGTAVSLEELAGRLAGVGRVERNAFLLRLAVDGYLLTVFPDGRTIVGGTDDVATARTVHARYVGA